MLIRIRITVLVIIYPIKTKWLTWINVKDSKSCRYMESEVPYSSHLHKMVWAGSTYPHKDTGGNIAPEANVALLQTQGPNTQINPKIKLSISSKISKRTDMHLDGALSEDQDTTNYFL